MARDSTAEEIARTKPINPPTLHRRFQRAQKQVLGTFPDSANDPPN